MLPENPSGLFGVSDFAPDGGALVLPGPQGTTLWDLDAAIWPAKACSIAGRELTSDGWETYFSSAGTQQPTCPELVAGLSAVRRYRFVLLPLLLQCARAMRSSAAPAAIASRDMTCARVQAGRRPHAETIVSGTAMTPSGVSKAEITPSN